MSKQSDANVMLARRVLRELSRDLSDRTAKGLCNDLDKALRTENQPEFLRLTALLPDIVREDTDPWRIRERLQVISTIRFPVWEIDEEDVLEKTRNQVNSARLNLSLSDLDIWRRAGKQIAKCLESVSLDFIGAHGPGIVSETSDSMKKREVCRINRQLRPFFDRSFRVPSNNGTWVEPTPSYRPAKVVMVPKDHKTLRMISAEPAHTQFIQQGFRIELEKAMKRHGVFRHIDIKDQDKQRALLAKEQIATVDLSCASDTIRVKHLLLLQLPLELRSLLIALRTPTQSFKQKTYPTQGLYPMGAAVCFPFETMLFFALAREYSWAETSVYPTTLGVYGDDIILPDYIAGGFMSFLRRSAFIPNASKSFVSGFFKETCGVHLYKGVDVTPVKIKKLAPRSDLDLGNLSYASYADSCDRHFTCLSRYLRSLVLFVPRERYNKNYQRREVSCIVERPKMTRYSYLGYEDALRTGRGQVPTNVITTSIGWQPLVVG